MSDPIAERIADCIAVWVKAVSGDFGCTDDPLAQVPNKIIGGFGSAFASLAFTSPSLQQTLILCSTKPRHFPFPSKISVTEFRGTAFFNSCDGASNNHPVMLLRSPREDLSVTCRLAGLRQIARRISFERSQFSYCRGSGLYSRLDRDNARRGPSCLAFEPPKLTVNNRPSRATQPIPFRGSTKAPPLSQVRGAETTVLLLIV